MPDLLHALLPPTLVPDSHRVDPDEAAATLYVLYSPQVADMLMGDYRWSPDRYEKRLARMILETVIR